ncbi:MAG TPA: hypothetical protein VF263_08850 [Longimicrobiaceae bacterium]
MTDAAAVVTDERVRVCPACDAPAEANETECSFCHAPLSGSPGAPPSAVFTNMGRGVAFSALAGAILALCGILGPAAMLYAAAANGKGAGAVAAPLLFFVLLMVPLFLAWKGYRAFGSRYAFLFVLLVVGVSFLVSAPVLVSVLSSLAGLAR